MSHAGISTWLALSCGALLLLVPPTSARAQSGPAVQIFTSANSGGMRIMPLERLPIGVSASVSAGYDTNVGSSSANDTGSFFSSANVGLTYSFGTERTRVGLSWGTGLTYYSRGGQGTFGDWEPDTSLNVSLSHGVSERLSLSAGIHAVYGVEPDFATGLSENRRSGNFFNTSDSITASYAWLERFSTVTSYSISVIKYDEEPLASLLNRYDHSISQQLRFLVLPLTTVVAQYGLSLAVYEVGDRGSMSQVFLAGVDQSLGPRLQGSLRAGAQLRSSDQEEGETFSPNASGSLSFVVGEKTSLSLTAQYATQESNIVEATSSANFSTGLQLSYAVTPRISSNMTAYYSRGEYTGRKAIFFDPQRGFFIAQPTFSEASFDLGVGLSYSVTPRLSANGSFHYTEVSSDLAARPYARVRYSGGLSYSF